MAELNSSLYDTTERLPAERGMILHVDVAGSGQPIDIIRMCKYGETEPEGIFTECARQLFAHDKEAWKDATIQMMRFSIGVKNRDSIETPHHASQLAFCFHQGLDRLDDAYTLKHYSEYSLFCRLNGLGISCWNAAEYYEAFKGLNEPDLLGAGFREPGSWFIQDGAGNRFVKGNLADCISAMMDLPLNQSTELMALSYQHKEGIVTESYRLSDVQLLVGLVNPYNGPAETYVADWIDKGVANFLVAFHYDELLDRLHKAGLEDYSRTSAFVSFVNRNKAVNDVATEAGVLSWPPNLKADGIPTKETLLSQLLCQPNRFMEALTQIERNRFVHGMATLTTDELMGWLVSYAQKTGLPLETLYEKLPGRLKAIALPKTSWSACRLDLARYVKGDPSSLVADESLGQSLQLSPEDWHVLVVKEPAALPSLPHEVICDWRFWHPMSDLARLGEPLKQLIPAGFYHDPEFQRHALMSGLVKMNELGAEVFGINADDYRKVLAYPGLSSQERMSAAYMSAALGVVLHDPNDLVLLPEKAINQQVLFVAAYYDVNLLNKVSEKMVGFHRLTDSQLRQALLAQTDNADEVARFADRLPKVYRTASVYKMLKDRLGWYGAPQRIQEEAFMGLRQGIEQDTPRSVRNRL